VSQIMKSASEFCLVFLPRQCMLHKYVFTMRQRALVQSGPHTRPPHVHDIAPAKSKVFYWTWLRGFVQTTRYQAHMDLVEGFQPGNCDCGSRTLRQTTHFEQFDSIIYNGTSSINRGTQVDQVNEKLHHSTKLHY